MDGYQFANEVLENLRRGFAGGKTKVEMAGSCQRRGVHPRRRKLKKVGLLIEQSLWERVSSLSEDWGVKKINVIEEALDEYFKILDKVK